MSTNYNIAILLILMTLFYLETQAVLVQQQPLVLEYHHGVLLKGSITVNLVWYGHFTPWQKSIIIDFINSLTTSPSPTPLPSVSSWWKTTESYRGGGPSSLKTGRQLVYQRSVPGKLLKTQDLVALATTANSTIDSISLVLTGMDVTVDGFCSRCGTHGSVLTRAGRKGTYVWVGNSETQCPGQCAWPFHQPIYGPQTPPLVAPNGDVGVDGMIINLATLLANTVTNPFNTGYFQGPATAPLEAVSACTGIFGSGSYPGYPGKALVDSTTGASYNANGVNGRKFLLPAMWDPTTSACKTLV